jgi:hypothetical protein
MPSKYERFFCKRLKPHFDALESATQRRNFARAVKRSMEIDINGNSPPAPASPDDLYSSFNISVRIQKLWGITLNKPDAMEFLRAAGYPGINTYFTRQHNRTSYKELFQRDAAIVGKNQMVLTYAEWLHLVDYTSFEPVLPVFLQDAL